MKHGKRTPWPAIAISYSDNNAEMQIEGRMLYSEILRDSASMIPGTKILDPEHFCKSGMRKRNLKRFVKEVMLNA